MLAAGSGDPAYQGWLTHEAKGWKQRECQWYNAGKCRQVIKWTIIIISGLSSQQHTNIDSRDAITQSGTSKYRGMCMETCESIPNQVPFTRGWGINIGIVQLRNLHALCGTG